MKTNRNPDVTIDATELMNNFRSARNKREQIEIEADLHCCSPRTIAEVLEKCGALDGTSIRPKQFSDVYQPVTPSTPRGGRPRRRIDEVKAMKLWREGVSVYLIAEACGCSHTTIENWAKANGLTRKKNKPGPKPKQKSNFKLDGGGDMKKERPVEEVLLDKEAEQERFERILASVDAGKAEQEPEEAPEEPAPQPPRITMEPRGVEPMSVRQFRTAMGRLLSDALDDAALSINGVSVNDIFSVEIVVRNERVLVDLRTRETGA